MRVVEEKTGEDEEKMLAGGGTLNKAEVAQRGPSKQTDLIEAIIHYHFT